MEINNVLKSSFEKWLNTLGYAQSTVYTYVHYIHDFFFYLKNSGIGTLEQIKPETLKLYFGHLQTRPCKRRPGALSQNTITGNIDALKRFAKYLQETGKPCFEINIKAKPDKATSKIIFTKAEIKALYKACNNDLFGTRDKAILSIFYGCGLRRSEGQQLDINDILLKEKLVFVRKGKNYKERYVPITEGIKADLENYIYQARQELLNYKNHTESALFLSSQSARRMGGCSLINRVKKLAKEAKLQKEAGLHTLRHSIATHLLQSGLSLEDVSRFLGHSSLESTQIYTHIANYQ